MKVGDRFTVNGKEYEAVIVWNATYGNEVKK